MIKLVFEPNTVYPNKLYEVMSGGTTIQIRALEQPDTKTLHKMKFIITALDKGWSVKKINDSYIFTKKHEGKREVFKGDYLDNFIGEMI